MVSQEFNKGKKSMALALLYEDEVAKKKEEEEI